MSRLFIAVEVSDAVKTLLASQQSDLKAKIGGDLVRWSDPSRAHLTLVFLGDIPASRLGVVRQGLDFACRRIAPLELQTATLGAFPSARRPSVLWTGVAGDTAALRALHGALVEQLDRLYKDERAFKPHLTLGRVKRFVQQAEVTEALLNAPDYAPEVWRVERVGLYSSTLKSSGAVHDLLHETAL